MNAAKTMARVTVQHLGCPGHFIAVGKCQFRRHSQVDGPGGSFRVSTVGDYMPNDRGGLRETIGAGADSFFETMVFRTTKHAEAGNEGCGCRQIVGLSGCEQQRYATAGEAQAGHERFIAKYRAIARKPRRGRA